MSASPTTHIGVNCKGDSTIGEFSSEGLGESNDQRNDFGDT